MKKLFLFVLLCCCASRLFATNYYPRNTAGLNLGAVGNWTDAVSGSGGTSPGNFTTAGNAFIVTDNAASYVFTTALTISGTGSSLSFAPTGSVNVTVSTTISAPTITIGSGATVTTTAAFTGTLNMTGTGILNYNVASYPTMGSFASGSTITFGGAIAHTIPAATYGIITTSNTSTLALSNAIAFTTFNMGSTGAVTISNVLTGGTMNINTGAGASTVSGSGRIIGTLNMSGSTTLNYNVTSGYPTLGTLTSGTTFVYGGASLTHSVQPGTYGNLTLSATSSTTNFLTTATTATYTVAGNLSFSAASPSVVNVCNVSSGTAIANLNVGGTFGVSNSGTFNVNGSSGGTTSVYMSVTGAASLTSTGPLNINNASGGTSYARLVLTSAFTMSTASSVLNVNKATGGTPSAALICNGTFAQSSGTLTIGGATAGVTATALDTMTVGGATVNITGGTFNLGASSATNNTNVFTASSATLTLTTGTINISSSSAGTGTNLFTVNAFTTSSGTFNGGAATGGTHTNIITVTTSVAQSSSANVRLNTASSGTTSTIMTVGTTYVHSGTGTALTIQGCSGGTNNYARLDVTGAFSVTGTGATLTVNGASGSSSNPVGRLRCSSTYGISGTGAVANIGNHGASVTGASDTVDVAGAATISNGTMTICTGSAASSVNRFICASTFALSTGTFNMCTNTAGSSTNYLTINGGGGTAMTLTSGTFNGGFPSATSGTFADTINVTSSTGDVSVGTCTFVLNKPSSTNTSTAAFLIGRDLTYTSSGTISLNGGTNGTANSILTVGGNISITTGQLNGITASGGTTTSSVNVTGNLSLTSSGQINVNSATGGTPVSKIRVGGTLGLTTGTIRVGNTSSAVTGAIDTLAVTGNTTINSGSFIISTNNGVSSTNAFIEAGTFTQAAGTTTVCSNTGGSSTNTFNVNASSGTVFTLTSGTFNVGASTTAAGTHGSTVNILADMSIGTATLAGNACSNGTSTSTVNITGNVSYSSTGSINLNTCSNAAATGTTNMTVGGNFTLATGGQLNVNSATAGTAKAKMTIGGTLGLTTGTIRVGNTSSGVTGAIDTLVVTGNSTMTSGNFYVCANNGVTSTNTFIENGTFTQTAGTLYLCQNTGGSSTNNFIVNSTATPCFTEQGGTFYGCQSFSTTSTSVNKLTLAGGYSQTSGTVYVLFPSITGTYNDTFNIAGTATISGGSFICSNGFGVACANFNNTSSSCLTLSGTGALSLITSANSGNVNFNCAGSFSTSSTGTSIAVETGASASGVAAMQINGNATFNSTTGVYVNWGSGTMTGNYIGITGNLSIAGAGNLTSGAPTGTMQTGFLFNGSGTSSSPQTLNYASSTTPTSGPIFTVNSGTYVKMLSNMALPTGTSPYSWMLVNSGGTLDCSTFTLSGGAASGTTTGLALNGTLATANTAGVNGSVTTTVKTFDAAANFIFNGSSAQVTGTVMPASFGSLTINNSAGVTLSQSETLIGNLTFTAGKLNTGAFTLSMPGSSTVTGAGTSAYVNGKLSKSISGLSLVNYEIGDNSYAPVLLSLTGASAGRISLKSTSGAHPQMATSGIAPTSCVTHYWTMDTSGGIALTTISPQFTYNLADITGGSNTGFFGQKYSSSTWAGSAYSSTNTATPYTSTPSGITSTAFTGDYIFGKKFAPVLTAASGATVDNPFDITFTDDAVWRAAITTVKVGTNTLPGSAYSISTAGQVTLDPSASSFLQTAGSFLITIIAPGYVDDTVTQIIGVGAATQLVIITNPGDAIYCTGPVSPQPVVNIADQYGNPTASTATVTASVGSGAWTIGGTTGVAAVAGTATFTTLTATSTAFVSGATMTFSCGAFSPVTSTGFNVPAPSPTLVADPAATVDAPFNVTFTDNAAWRAAITAIKIGTNTLPGSAYSVTAGNIQFTPSASAFLQTVGTYTITVIATSYGADPVTQYIGPGAVTQLSITTQPVAPLTNPGIFATQPVISLLDQYNNLATTSSATITASASGATWTIGGTTSNATTAGVTSYSDLAASAAAYTPGATITFSATGLTPVVSTTFNVPYPYGTFTYGTGGTFPTLASAIATLNSVAFGGPIILNSNVNGWTETAPSGGYNIGSTTLNGSLNSTNTYTINGYPGGANTVITAPTGTGSNDYVFAINGADYLTINGINIQEDAANTTPTTKMEYGYAFFNLNTSSPVDGCQNDQLKNCVISLDKTNTNGTYGIVTLHKDNTGTAATPAVVADLHSNNKIYTNTISNCQYPIYLSGYNAGSPYTLYDQNNDVGGSAASTGNTATNWGATGSVSGPGAGVYLAYQNNANASYNNLNNVSGGSANVSSLYGIYCSGTNSTFIANRNTITLSEQSSSGANVFNAIHAESAGSNLTASFNTITMSETAGSNVTTNGIFSATSVGNNFTAKSNTIGITMSISGGANDLSGIYSNSTGVLLVQSNSVTMTNSSAANACVTSFYRITGGAGGTQTMNFNTATGTGMNTSNNIAAFGNTVNASNLKINNNRVNITSVATSGTIAVGIANSGFNTIQEMNNNNITIDASSMNVGTPAGIYNLGGASTSLDCNYDTITVTTNNSSATGVYNANTTSIPSSSFSNNILSVNSTVSGTGSVLGIYNNRGVITTFRANNNAVTLNAYNGGAIYGIVDSTGNVVGASISNNNITGTSTTGVASGIYNTFDASIANVFVDSNTIDLSVSGASISAIYYIYYKPTVLPTVTGGSQNCSYNVFKSTSGFPSHTGLFYFVGYMSTAASGFITTNNITYNQTSGTITRNGNGGSFYCIYSRCPSTGITGVQNISNNSFTNINLGSGNAVGFWGIIAGWNTGVTENITYNTFDNLTLGSVPSSMIMASGYAANSSLSYNKMSNVTSSATSLFGMTISTVGADPAPPAGIGNVPGTIATPSGLGGSLYGNSIHDFTNTNASGIVYGIQYYYNSTAAFSGNFDFYQDTIYNLTVTGAASPAIYGIYQLQDAHTLLWSSKVRNCIFHDFNSTNASASPVIMGLHYSWVDTAYISNNLMYNFSTGSASGTGTQIVGINVVNKLAGTDQIGSYNIYNNSISGFTASASNNPNSIIGIWTQAPTLNTWNVYDNTIALGGLGVGTPGTPLSGGTNFGATGLLFPKITSSVLNFKNNIVYMNVNPSGTGISSCIQRNMTGTAGTAPSASLFVPNYNIYYTNSGGSAGSTPNNYLYVDDTTGGSGIPINGYALSGLTPSGTNNIVNDPGFNGCSGSSYTTSYKAFMGGANESLTYTECNLTSSGFSSGTCGPTGASFAYQSGLAITTPSITTDLSGATRSTPPSRGANEFSGTAPSSGAPPVISYTPILTTSYCIANPPSLSAAITSAAGINVTAGTKPRLYYKGNVDNNTLGATNDNTTDGWKYVEASNASSPFNFQPDYAKLYNAAGVGTTISYFVVAQDNSGTPLVGYNIVGLAAGYCPSSVALASGAFPVLASPSISNYVITAVPSFTSSVTPANFYGSANNATLTLSPSNSDLTLQWQMDYVGTSGSTGFSSIFGATTNNYSAAMPGLASTPAIASPGTTGNVSFKALLSCNSSIVATSSTTAVNDYTPQVLTTTNGSRCGTGPVSIAATGSTGGTVNWYAASTGGTPVATGNSYSPSLSATNTYYVADTFGTYGTQSVGKLNMTGSALYFTVYTGYTGNGLYFTVNNDCRINSVDIYSLVSGYAFTISVYDVATHNIVGSYSGTTTGGGTGTPQTVPVGFYLAPGNYKMAYSAFPAASGMYVNSSFTGFPLTYTPNTITITSCQDGGLYDNFYNWQVSAAVISSPRVPVTATVNPLPLAGTVGASPASVCSGFTTVLSETGSITPPLVGDVLSSYSWTGPSGYASSGMGTSVGSRTVTPVSGYYSLTVTYPGTGCTSTPVSTYVTVNPATTPTISGTYTACVGASQTLSVTPSGGTWSSSNAAVASVDPSTGVVTGVHAGSCNITYTSPCSLTTSHSFTVNPTPTSISGPTSICVTSSYPTYTVTCDGSSAGAWSSSPLSVAVIGTSSGTLTSMSVGAATITYTCTSGCSLTSPLNVSNVGPASITGPSSLCVGNSITLADSTIGGTWSSADNSIATVDGAGVVTGVSTGTVAISYVTGCLPHATASVTVNGASLVLSNSGPLCSGATLNLTATPSTSLTSFLWTGPNGFSNNISLTPAISTVTTAASGTYTFSATAGGCSSSATMAVIVGQLPSASVTPSSGTICSGGASTLNLTPSPSAYTVYAVPYAPVLFTPTGTLTSASSWTSTYDDGYAAVSLPSGFAFSFYGTSYSTVYINANGYVTFGSGVASGSSTPLTLPSASAPSKMAALFWHDMNMSTGSITYGSTGTIPNRKFIISYNAVPDASDTNSGQIILYEATNVIEMMVTHTGASTKTCGVQNGATLSALTAPGENNATYSVTGSGCQGWRFAVPSYNYAWSPATALSSTSAQSPISSGLTSSQVYSVNLYDTYSACTSGTSATGTVNVVALPSVSLLSASTGMLCSGGNLTLSATASGGTGTPTYTWSGPGIISTSGSSATSPVFNPTVAAATTGTYSVALSYTAPGCTTANATSSSVSLATQPSVTVSPSGTTLCSGDTLVLTETTVSGGIGTPTYTWNGAGISTTTGSSATSPYFVPTVSSGTYGVAVDYSGTGCITATNTTAVVTVNTRPSITPGATPTICQGTTSTSLAYTGASGTPTTYGVLWDAAAHTAGFTDVTSASLSGGSISLTVPGGAPAGSYTATLTVANTLCTSYPYTIGVNVNAYPTAAITSAAAPCSGHTTNIVFSGTSGAVISYMVDSASVLTATLTGGSFTLVTAALTAPHNYTLIDVTNSPCTTSVDTVTTLSPAAMHWVGTTSGDWNTPANWSCGFVPTSIDDVTIDTGTTFSADIAAAATGTTKSLTLIPTARVTVNSGATLNVTENLVNNGVVTGTGKLSLSGSSSQTVSGIGIVSNFDLNNSAGAALATASRLTVKSKLSIAAGSLATNDSVVLYSDTFATALISPLPSGTSITGNVKVMQYIVGGMRRFRFMSHPFSTYIPLSQIENYIDITGVGGSANGFTTTASNAPSAFRYNPLVGNSSLPADIGWRPFTSVYATADSNRFHKYQGIRIMCRGAKGEGLYYASNYVPSAATIAMWGPVNQGNQVITLARGSDTLQQYNMVGNPYPSPVDIGTVLFNARAAGNLYGPAFFVWNPNIGPGGHYQTIFFGGSATPYYIQANCAFQVQAAHNGDTLNFTESDKGNPPATSLIRAVPQYTSLMIYDSNYHPWDAFYLQFNEQTTDHTDKMEDASRPSGSDFNFYSLSADHNRLAVDSRPYTVGKVIPLGISSGYSQDLIIKAESIVVPEGGKLYLHDKLLKQYVLLQQGTEYRFSITRDKATQGENRFELTTEPASVARTDKGLQVQMVPNPASDDVTISFTSGKLANVGLRIMDLSGITVYDQAIGTQQSGSIKVSLNNLASGVYMVEVTSGSEKIVQRLVKE